jgi:hypothetical protein
MEAGLAILSASASPLRVIAMKSQVNPLKPMSALSLSLLLAAAPLQPAHGASLGEVNVRSEAGSAGGTLRGAPDEEGQPAEDAPQAQDDAGDDPSAESPEEAEPEAAGDETGEPADDSEGSADESEDSTDDSEGSADESEDPDDEGE